MVIADLSSTLSGSLAIISMNMNVAPVHAFNLRRGSSSSVYVSLTEPVVLAQFSTAASTFVRTFQFSLAMHRSSAMRLERLER